MVLTKGPLRMKPNQSSWNFSLLFLALLILKAAIASFLPLVGDEAYYWIWGQNLQLSYYDHPPAVGVLTWLSSFLSKSVPFVNKTLSVRLPFILMSTITLLVWIKLFQKKEEDSQYLKWFVIFYLLNPLLGVGGVFATPDVPLLFFWSLSYYCAVQAIQSQKNIWYTCLGVFLGLGFCSKYHIVLLPLTILISLWIDKKIKFINFKKLFLTFIFGFIFSLPVLIWNYQNNWVSFLFQINHGFKAKSFDLTWPLSYFAGQILLFNPVLILALIKKTKSDLDKNMSLSQWGFFTYSSTKALVEANWPITAHNHGLLALGNKIKSYYKLSIFYWIIIWFTLISLFSSSFGKNKFEKFPQAFAAKEIYQDVKEFKPLYGPSYQMASLLTFVSGENIPKLKNLSRYDFYDTLSASQPTTSRFYVLKYDSTDWPIEISSLKQKPQLIKKLDKYNLELYLVVNE